VNSLIQLQNVSLKFDTKTIYDNYSYTFEKGKIYCIMGKSGCGKTTMLRLMCGLLNPDSGIITYDGQKVKKQQNNIFMMHQSYTNFLWKTCLDNVLLPIQLKKKIEYCHRQDARQVLQDVGLANYSNNYPYELSGGMNQRLALARVLIANPNVLLMDEPLSSLDPITRSEMQDIILSFHEKTGNTIIMVTHDVDEANKMSDVLIKL